MSDTTAEDRAVDVDDLLEDPRTDIEALCLGALLWSPAVEAQRVTDIVTATDFDRPVFGELFTVISEQLKAGKPHDPASIGAALAEAGKSAGSHHGALLRFALTQATLSGAAAEFAGHYAQMVMSAAYRRGFHAAAASMTQAAAELPQDQLFAHLLSIGRQQRTATQRLARINGALSDTLPGGVIGETEHDIVKEPQ